MILTLPFPPSVNQLYGYNSSTHSIYLKPIGKNYKTAASFLIAKQMKEQRAVRIEKPCSIIVHFSPPDKRFHDIDNLYKILFDTLTYAGAWKDDSLCKERYDCKFPPEKPGSLILQIIQSDDLLFHTPIPFFISELRI